MELYYKCVLGVFKCHATGCILDMLNTMWALNLVHVVVCNIYEQRLGLEAQAFGQSLHACRPP